MLVNIVLPYRLPTPLIYELPPEFSARPGTRVVVPLGNRHVIGCLVGEATEPAPRGLKKVLHLLDEEPILTPTQSKLLTWASHYYLTPVGEVLRHLLPPSLFKKESLRARKSKPLPNHADFEPTGAIVLNQEQITVLEKTAASRGPFLLEGITGSGKTEVYIELARKALERGENVLVLVPEISLTPQLSGRLQKGLAREITPYHSGLTPAQRSKIWLGVRWGEIPLVVGTRSAIFLPFPRLKLIIVDEEHDPSYKQEERFCYNARDLALWRGKEEESTILLGSATPSLESLYRSRMGKLIPLRLNTRPQGALLPKVQLIDRRSKKANFLSEPLQEALLKNLRRGEQSLLFLNRRGFAPFLLCTPCGFIPRCPECEISLTYHKKGGKTSEPYLVCHYCDAQSPTPPSCPKCHSPLSPEGIGTERIEERLKKQFPRARIARLDRDTTAGDRLVKILSRMKRQEIDILVGTQTVTKGHDFPNLTLVGIIDADTALNLPDFRASERTFQLVTQVSGRSGRGEKPGTVLIQTYHSDHPALVAAANHDETGFVDSELFFREAANYPPFTRLIRIILSGKHGERVEKGAQLLAHKLRGILRKDPNGEAQVLGPAPCPRPRIRSRSRWHILIKSRQFAKFHPHLQPLLDDVSQNGLPSGVRMLVNVDPIDMM